MIYLIVLMLFFSIASNYNFNFYTNLTITGLLNSSLEPSKFILIQNSFRPVLVYYHQAGNTHTFTIFSNTSPANTPSNSNLAQYYFILTPTVYTSFYNISGVKRIINKEFVLEFNETISNISFFGSSFFKVNNNLYFLITEGYYGFTTEFRYFSGSTCYIEIIRLGHWDDSYSYSISLSYNTYDLYYVVPPTGACHWFTFQPSFLNLTYVNYTISNNSSVVILGPSSSFIRIAGLNFINYTIPQVRCTDFNRTIVYPSKFNITNVTRTTCGNIYTPAPATSFIIDTRFTYIFNGSHLISQSNHPYYDIMGNVSEYFITGRPLPYEIVKHNYSIKGFFVLTPPRYFPYDIEASDRRFYLIEDTSGRCFIGEYISNQKTILATAPVQCSEKYSNYEFAIKEIQRTSNCIVEPIQGGFKFKYIHNLSAPAIVRKYNKSLALVVNQSINSDATIIFNETTDLVLTITNSNFTKTLCYYNAAPSILTNNEKKLLELLFIIIAGLIPLSILFSILVYGLGFLSNISVFTTLKVLAIGSLLYFLTRSRFDIIKYPIMLLIVLIILEYPAPERILPPIPSEWGVVEILLALPVAFINFFIALASLPYNLTMYVFNALPYEFSSLSYIATTIAVGINFYFILLAFTIVYNRVFLKW